MIRYIAVVWDDRARELNETAKAHLNKLSASGQWRLAFEGQGLAILIRNQQDSFDREYLIEHNSGIVLGRLFRNCENGSTSRESDIEAPTTLAVNIAATDGRDLLEHYWGRYVAFVQRSTSGGVSILRDPSGVIPCFLETKSGVRIIFSDIEDYLLLRPVTLSINWTYIADISVMPVLHTRDTGLEGISEILPGENVGFLRGAVSRSFDWFLYRVRALGQIHDVDVAIETLRTAVCRTVNAWASCFENVVHSLSGGLDSSIVLSYLSAAPSKPAVTCLSYYSSRTNEDERRFARIAAQRAGVATVDVDLSARAVSLEECLVIKATPKPSWIINEADRAPLERDLAVRIGAKAIFAGNGGDSVFCRDLARYACADYVREHGLGSRLLQVAWEGAKVSNRSIASVLLFGFKSQFLQVGSRPHKFRPNRSFIPDEIVRAACERGQWEPTWARELGGCAGKMRHIVGSALVPALPGIVEESGIARINPLLSQPVVEACWRVPTYLWFQGGVDRALVRRAFKDKIPAEICRRLSKGGIHGYMSALLDSNLNFAAQHLLDGILVHAGILDSQKLAACLLYKRGMHGEYADIVHDYLCTELWLRKWKGNQYQNMIDAST